MESTEGNGQDQSPDAFLSHSSKDKDLFVRPLVQCLTDHGARVWYDEYALEPGSSLSASIDAGLSRAKSGLVVVSRAFIETARESGWTSYELRGIVTNSIGPQGRRIIPIWLDVDYEIVRDFSPPLADLLAITVKNKPIEQVALEVLQVIAPHLATGLSLLRMLQSASGGSVEMVPLETLVPSPARNRRVGGHVPLRALLITQSLSDCGESHASDYKGFLENLSRDIHHEKELRTWEAIACSYSVASTTYTFTPQQKNALYRFILSQTLGSPDMRAAEELTLPVAASVAEHFSSCMDLATNDAVIGGDGLIGVIKEDQTDSSN